VPSSISCPSSPSPESSTEKQSALLESQYCMNLKGKKKEPLKKTEEIVRKTTISKAYHKQWYCIYH
jgi:hypothetical protein